MIVPLIGVVPVLVAVNEGTLPAPDAPRPIAVLLLVQLKLTPAGVPDKMFEAINVPSVTVVSKPTELTVPTGFTVTLSVAVGAAHCPAVVVNV